MRDADLTSRERDVMALVVIGILNKQVGSRLGISEITVKKHRGNAMRQMKAESLPQLVKMATRLRLPQASSESVIFPLVNSLRVFPFSCKLGCSGLFSFAYGFLLNGCT